MWVVVDVVVVVVEYIVVWVTVLVFGVPSAPSLVSLMEADTKANEGEVDIAVVVVVVVDDVVAAAVEELVMVLATVTSGWCNVGSEVEEEEEEEAAVVEIVTADATATPPLALPPEPVRLHCGATTTAAAGKNTRNSDILYVMLLGA